MSRQHMRLTVSIVAFVLLAAIFAAPLLAAASSPVAVAIYAAFSWACHQRPERCWHLAGYPLAVCMRCLGIYAGALAGSLLGLRFSRRLLLLSLGLLGTEWVAEVLGWVSPPAMTRVVFGFLAGCLLVSVLAGEQGGGGFRTLWVREEVKP
ncbi:MAG: DUF2085 domain-containing protein [Acidobacteria bacterium]|nr:DUF2085 domain-containing protein [Acidobacteriota bacterium]